MANSIPPVMPSAADVLDREFLQLRAKLLEIAAQLDRLDRATGGVHDDARMQGIKKALTELAGAEPTRAERVQMIFSRPYDARWKKNMEMGNAE